jgi:signal transduction histidine kinase
MTVISSNSIIVDRWLHTLVLFFGVTGVLLVAWISGRQAEETLAHYRADSTDITRHKAADIETRLALVYQGLRTIARLPAIRNIDRYGSNLDATARHSAEEIYNNLLLNVSVSEVDVIPANFDPDALDPLTGRPQVPAIQFDDLVETGPKRNPAHQIADASKSTEAVRDVDIFEHREMREQYRKLAARFGDESKLDYLAYPSISGGEVATCYALRSGGTKPCTGIVVSVPLYGPDRRIKGMVSAVITSAVVADMLGAGEWALLHSEYGALSPGFKPTAEQRAAMSARKPETSRLYSEIVPLRTADAYSAWQLWTSRDDAGYWARHDVRALSTTTNFAYLCIGALTALLYLAVHWQHLTSNAVRARYEDLEQIVEERTRQLSQARAEAEAAHEAKSAFLVQLSNELRTSLNSIMGFSMVLSQEMYGRLGDPRYKTCAGDIWAAGNHLLSLANDSFELSRTEAGKLKMHDEPTRVFETVRDVLRSVATAARDAGVELAADIPEGTTVLNVDSQRLAQALANLTKSAIGATPKGGTVRLSFRLEGLEPVFCVSDTSNGMTAEQAALALMPFGLAGNEHRSNQASTGLCLPLAKRLVDAMGGTFVIDSAPGNGTHVRVRLPTSRLLEESAVRCVA